MWTRDSSVFSSVKTVHSFGQFDMTPTVDHSGLPRSTDPEENSFQPLVFQQTSHPASSSVRPRRGRNGWIGGRNDRRRSGWGGVGHKPFRSCSAKPVATSASVSQTVAGGWHAVPGRHQRLLSSSSSMVDMLQPHQDQHSKCKSLSHQLWFLADHTNGRAIGTVLRPPVCRVCDVMYCG